MDFEKLAAFRTVAAEKSFSRAGAKLAKTQPAISQAIRSLEDELGERLFSRRGRATALTQAGRVLLDHVNQAFTVLERGRDALSALQGLRAGELVIATSDTTACYVLPDVLRAFRERYPGVEVIISNRPSPAAAAQVAAHEADVAFCTLPVVHPGLESETLVTREDVAICASNHPLAGRRRIRLVELLAYPLLLLDRGSRTRGFIDEQMRAVPREPRIAMEIGSIEVIKKLVALDFGVSIVPEIAIREELERGSLHALRVFPRSAARKLGVVRPKTTPLPPAADVFVRLARDMLTPNRVRPGTK